MLNLATRQAHGASREGTEEEEQKIIHVKAKRQLLADVTTFGRKANPGGSDTKDVFTPTGSTDNTKTNPGKTGDDDNNNSEDNDDANESYENYGAGSNTESRHVFVTDHRPDQPSRP
ncbi:hypothetical protein O6P43_021876 [Quillaja saponaria]|uniref:Uncharacterized protein n=1 Tax=Quillaja saponaria TaxID=32244 RepID=A0AAD7LBU7_QUISA|nr:hypothetical protein O6P43_021876 [Quillaja saponaria]